MARTYEEESADDLKGGELQKNKGFETIAWGADAEVRLHGEFADKIFRKLYVYEHESRILGQLPRHPGLIQIIADDKANATLRFPRYCTDLMRCLMAEMHVPAQRCCMGLASAVAHCHHVGLVHRDIKPENVLLDCDFTPILCDFSRALFAPEPMFARFAGTDAYSAPEARYGRCCTANDVWSLGIVFFCIVEMLFPFDSDDKDVQLAFPKESPAGKLEFTSLRWEGPFGQVLRSELSKCLCVSPDLRVTVHRVLTNLCDQDIASVPAVV